MKAEDIRKKAAEVEKALKSLTTIEGGELVLKAAAIDLLLELAAQVAEANESLKCIAHPLIEVVNEGPQEDVKTLRDEFAMAALQGMLADPNVKLEGTAKLAYKVADEMLEARKK